MSIHKLFVLPCGNPICCRLPRLLLIFLSVLSGQIIIFVRLFFRYPVFAACPFPEINELTSLGTKRSPGIFLPGRLFFTCRAFYLHKKSLFSFLPCLGLLHLDPSALHHHIVNRVYYLVGNFFRNLNKSEFFKHIYVAYFTCRNIGFRCD